MAGAEVQSRANQPPSILSEQATRTGSFIPVESSVLLMAIHLGCGSWTDSEYSGLLYPTGIAASQRLATYATWFDHVEVNSTYYAAPREKITAGWAKQTPPGFIFHIKLHRIFSQNPHRAATEGSGIDRLLKGVSPLIRAKKFGVFLLVLSPTFSPHRHSLSELDAVAEKLLPHSLAVELRHRDWVKGKARQATLDYFREHELVWVAVDMPRLDDSSLMPPIDEVTRPGVAYLRLHGRNPQYLEAKSAAARHEHEYTPRELSLLAQRIKKLARAADEVHVVANNHARDYAPKAALKLQELLGLERRKTQ